ncbi:MAG TPA: FGGY family carbohydrate kinase [Saprospiraceae bacterium]|nr:FGGY family carbohydrate kinase [Saprospiraceae bacterium]
MYLLGLDIGSSSIKAALVSADSGAKVAHVQSPDNELPIHAPQAGWAEQDPETWWQHAGLAIRKLLHITGVSPGHIRGIGLAYQMHGLVLLDKGLQVLRPSIIWCDSRAVDIGQQAFEQLGQEQCLGRLLNSPGNFTASKLRWVRENEPAVYERIRYFMLPGDYIAFRLSGEALSTPGGLSEGVLWDFSTEQPARLLLDHYDIDPALIPPLTPALSMQGRLSPEAAAHTGLKAGTPLCYRAGDQPNNALSLNVLSPGEVAATGGTSGVVYGVVDRPLHDSRSRVNGFLHVNHRPENPRIGILLCINGAGSQYAWVKRNVAEAGLDYPQMEAAAAALAPGSDGLRILPFGNGAERMLDNRDPGAHILGLRSNLHTRAHLYRATLEGIAFSFVYGVGIMQDMGLTVNKLRVGNDNLFQSAVFSRTMAGLLRCPIEIYDTSGAVGAAIAAGAGLGHFASLEEGLAKLRIVETYEPEQSGGLEDSFEDWKGVLGRVLED